MQLTYHQANPAVIQPPSSTAMTTSTNNHQTSSTKPAHPQKGSPLNKQESTPSKRHDKQQVPVDAMGSTNTRMTAMQITIDGNHDSRESADDKLHEICVANVEDASGSNVDRSEDQWISFDEDLMKDIAKELDNWDNESDATEHLQNYQHTSGETYHHQNSHSAQGTSTYGSTLPIDMKCHQPQETVRLSQRTPSRADVISHIAPVTLLSCSGNDDRGKSGVVSSPVICRPSSKTPAVMNTMVATHFQLASTNNSTSQVCVVKETPPFSAGSPTDHHSRAMPSCSGTHRTHQQILTLTDSHHVTPPMTSTHKSSTTSIASTLSSTTHNGYKTPNSAISFRTPSTSEWMKVKRLSTDSTHTPPYHTGSTCTPPNYTGSTHTPPNHSSILGGDVLSSGGKVTPPLCHCGRRTKLRTVSNPGPNEGKTFYACPNGKASDKCRGCGFFKWEKKLIRGSCSPQSHVASHSYLSNTTLEPEYLESKR